MATVIKCYNCGNETIFQEGEETKKCRSCKKTIVMKKMVEVNELTPIQKEIQKMNLQMALNKVDNKNDKNEIIMSLGLIALSSGSYNVAQTFFKQLIDQNVTSGDVYFYYCLALLNGKRPFLHLRSTVDQIIQYLDFALALESKGEYYYLQALMIYDYYKLKSLRHERNYAQLLQMATYLGISQGEINEIYKVVKMNKPAGF